MEKNPIFEILENIDSGNIEWVDDEKNEEVFKKNSFVLGMWKFGTKNKNEILKIDRFVDKYTFTFSNKHPKLYYYLHCIASDGVEKNYKWIKREKNLKNSMLENLMSSYYDISPREASESVSLVSKDMVLNMAEQMGLPREDIKKIESEYDSRK